MGDVFMHTYHRLPVTFTQGQGVWLVDDQGKRYLDFTAGIAVNCLGHGYPPLVKAVADQAAKLIHTSNYYHNSAALAFAEKLIAACAAQGMQKVFLANSGAEANEGACKIARKYSFKKYGAGRHRIVTLKGSFHGRTITTLSATGQERFHKDFGPFTEGFRFTPPGDIDALDRALDPEVTAGFLVEPVQGESGVFPQTAAYMEAAARLCAERDILFMADEIQCGVGRTGAFLACENYGIRPDVVTLAKGLAGGIPIGAVLAGEKAAEVFAAGDHGSTFGGNPLAAAAGLAVLEVVTKPDFLQEIARKGARIEAALRSWNQSKIREIRSQGLMVGIDIDGDAAPVLEAGITRAQNGEAGLLILSAGPRTLRLLPPYVISDGEIDQGLDLLRRLTG
ncbi:MAG: aspartate aminotransferase family protein [Treponema sp.]|jgi:acetylornithine/N-succinyldiaminopimelate aminotransferase|nr:aspartate aminotransferase family protein [Treponema sp.]